MKKFVNFLTLFRLFITFFLPLLWFHLNPLVLLIIIILILLTDFVDGKLARGFHVQSLFGSIADAVADKVFGVVIILIIGSYNHIFYMVALGELIISAITIFSAFVGVPTKSSFVGKAKMWLLGFTTVIGFVYIFDGQLLDVLHINWLIELIKLMVHNEEVITYFCVFTTFGAQLIVAVDYLKRTKKSIKTRERISKKEIKDTVDFKFALFDTEYYLKNKEQALAASLMEDKEKK